MIPTSRLDELMSAEGVPSGFAAARDGIDALLRDRGMRRTTPEQTADSLLRGAQASAVLEGSTSSLEDVRAGHGDEIAGDAVRVSVELLSLAPLLASSPLQALARIHSVAAAGLPADRRGRPANAEAAARLRAVSELLLTSGKAPGMLVAALVHAELAGGTFPSHNGIVARAAERLVLVARGVDERSLVVPEAGHLALRPAYESNLRAYAAGRTEVWLRYAAEAYAAGAEASPLRSAG